MKKSNRVYIKDILDSARQIVGYCKDYNYVNVDEVWKVVKEDLPVLIKQLESTKDGKN